MKKVFLALFAGTLTFASCMNDWDNEMVDNDLYSAENIGEPTTTLSQLRKDYASEISNISYKLVEKDENQLLMIAHICRRDLITLTAEQRRKMIGNLKRNTGLCNLELDLQLCHNKNPLSLTLVF